MLLAAVLLISACQSPPARLHELALAQGFSSQPRMAAGYQLSVYRHNRDRNGGPLHIYLEGDGTPWQHRIFVTADPTPRSPMMLELMADDDQAAAYVGRPCYNGSFDDAGCDSRLWTSARYSRTVVASQKQVIETLRAEHGASELWLFGHSGGGALAMLLAQELEGVRGVVTLAGNLDTDSWTSHHGYQSLYGSLNPALQPALPMSVIQWHLLGERDSVIPPALVLPWIRRQDSATAIVLRGFDHGCCWAQIWPRVLRDVQHARLRFTPGTRVEGLKWSRAPRRPEVEPESH